MMSRITKLAAVTLAAATLVASASLAQAQTRVLRYADFGPDRGSRAEVIKWMDSEMRARSDGALGLDITWGGTLLGAKNAIDGVGNGVADLASVVPVYEPGKLTAWRVSDVRQIADEYVGMMATYELMTQNEAAIKNFADQGVRYVSNFTTGPTQLLSREQITNLDELKGKKVRATGSFGKAFEANGAAAVSMSQPDVYQALSTGTIDGTASYAYVINSYKQYEVATHLTTIDMGQNLGWGIVMNGRVWDSFSPEQQTMMTELGQDATLYMAQKMYEDRTQIMDTLRAGVDGITIVEHDGDPAMKSALIEAAESAGMEWMGGARDQGLPADDLLAAFDAAVAKYHKEMEVQGYPWAKK